MKHQRLYLMAFVVVSCATATGGVIASRTESTRTGKVPPASSRSTQEAQLSSGTGYPDRIRPTRLSPQLRVPFTVLGDRLAKRGKERLSSVGTMSRSGASLPVMVECEFPNLLRVAGQAGVLISFNARLSADRQIAGQEDALVETLFFDAADYFFVAQLRGAATRFLGARISLSEEARATGLFYDVYEVTDHSRGGSSPRTKRYFFNSDTQLLEVVRYESDKAGTKSSVETHFGGWRKMQGQQVPATIMRLENGQTIFSFIFNTTTLTSRSGSPNSISPNESGAY